jgi:hypothetical protein
VDLFKPEDLCSSVPAFGCAAHRLACEAILTALLSASCFRPRSFGLSCQHTITLGPGSLN